MRIALATCRNIPEPDVDEPLVLEAFAKADVEAKLLAWDDPAASFGDYDLVILRSTWNYFEHLDEFLAWAARMRALRNPLEIVRWNAVKTYLRDLEARGVAVVPTTFVSKGENARLADVAWKDVVVKPVVSAGSFCTERFDHDDPRGQVFLDGLSRERDVMIQKWMPAVNDYGERSLVLIDGEFTHAIRKSPRFAGGEEHVSDEMPIAPDERAFAEKAIAAAQATDLLYGRVDIIRDDDGTLRVMELELVEPSLFFKQCPRALDRFVASAMKAVRRS
jgi:glutathione synthase/RimK-type ligase-like ATP-grasp enzyme